MGLQEFKDSQESWKLNNPDFEYKLWSDDENRELIRSSYPFFLSRYDAYRSPILRADAARIFYLHKYGGVYADLDVLCLKSIRPLLQNHELILGQLTTLSKPILPFVFHRWEYLHALPNAWMASRPGHLFWMFVAKRMLEADENLTVEEATGPVMIWRSLSEFIKIGGIFWASVFIADSELLYPYSWTWPSGETEHS
ncbi:hypothetical protein HK100_005193, partial [Physocladia obscura]